MIMDEDKVVESISESYGDSENICIEKNPAAGKWGLTRNPEHAVQTT